MAKKSDLLIFSPELNMDIYYATRFSAPDEIIYLFVDGKSYLFLKQLEFERAKSQSCVDEVILLDDFEDKEVKLPEPIDTVCNILKKFQITECRIHKEFPVFYAEKLKAAGYKLSIEENDYFPQRMIKTEKEKDYIWNSMKVIEEAMKIAEDMLKQAKVNNEKLFLGKNVLTSEMIKTEMALHFVKNNYYADYSIVSCGDQTVEPHNNGSGPIYANKNIIIDIFPRSLETKYYGDMTRTFIKGKPTKEQKRLYDTVKKAQEDALRKLKAEVDGEKIHGDICQFFENQGYKTGPLDGKLQGFIHSTGHGLGLNIHENIRIAKKPFILKAGNVVTVEPGLYYYSTGGVRIEDTVLVTENGIINLTSYQKNYELD